MRFYIYGIGRISQANLGEYLEGTYGSGVAMDYSKVIHAKPLLQTNYGKAQDCTLTSIATVINYETDGKFDVANIYKTIEGIAQRHLYNGDKWGTIPIFIKRILEKALRAASSPDRKTRSHYFKCIGVTWRRIAEQLDSDNLVILNIWNDGRDFYKNHTVTAIGYETYLVNGHLARMLVVYDNWNDEISYIDYDALSPILSINYINRRRKRND